MTTKRVPRTGRILDLAALLLFLAGGALYARSWLGLRAIDDFRRGADDALFAAIAHADALSRIGRLGLVLMAAGGVVAIVAALVARRMARRPAKESAVE